MDIFSNLIFWVLLIFFGLVILRSAIKIVAEYERGVIFRLGRVQGAKGPGLFFIIPVVDQMIKVDLRVVTLDVPTQEAITRDNVTIKVNAVCYFRVIDPVAAVVNVSNYLLATGQIAQTTLRSVMGQSELDELLAQRDKINQQLQQIIDEQTEPWGVKVSIVEVKDLELPQTMQRAMARQAEAEREKRAKIIHAEGELQASETLAQAAAVMAAQSGALQLRYLQTLSEISAEHNSTIIFPLPIELMRGILGGQNSTNGGPRSQRPSRRRDRVIRRTEPVMQNVAGSHRPKNITVDRPAGVLRIAWQDGHESEYSLRWLRANCPCATCREERRAIALDADPLRLSSGPLPSTEIAAAELVGNYAIRLDWRDGHSTGIYTFAALRESCPCAECLPEGASEPPPLLPD